MPPDNVTSRSVTMHPSKTGPAARVRYPAREHPGRFPLRPPGTRCHRRTPVHKPSKFRRTPAGAVLGRHQPARSRRRRPVLLRALRLADRGHDAPRRWGSLLHGPHRRQGRGRDLLAAPRCATAGGVEHLHPRRVRRPRRGAGARGAVQRADVRSAIRAMSTEAFRWAAAASPKPRRTAYAARPMPGDCDELACYRLGQGDPVLDLALAALTRVAELGGSPRRDWASSVTSWRSSPRS